MSVAIFRYIYGLLQDGYMDYHRMAGNATESM